MRFFGRAPERRRSATARLRPTAGGDPAWDRQAARAEPGPAPRRCGTTVPQSGWPALPAPPSSCAFPGPTLGEESFDRASDLVRARTGGWADGRLVALGLAVCPFARLSVGSWRVHRDEGANLVGQPLDIDQMQRSG